MPKSAEEQREYNRKYYAKNREKCREYNNAAYKRNRAKILAHKQLYRDTMGGKEQEIQCRVENREKHILKTAKNRAKKIGLDFTIGIEDLVIPEYCPYLGVKLTKIFGRGKIKTNSSIDRIDNTKGYIKGNVQIISDLANTMKSSASIDQLVTFARNVLRIHE